MGTNCAPPLADLFLYSYEANFIQGLLQKNEKKLARSINFKFRNIDDVLLLTNSRFGDFVDRIYPIELEIKDTTNTGRSASYLDLHLEIDSEGWLRTKLSDKRDDFNFPIVNFPFICNNIPAAPAYGVYISQLIRYSRACGSYQDFLDRVLLLTRKLLNQGFLLVRLKSSLGKFYGRHHDLVDRYGISVSQMTTDMFHFPVLSSFMTSHRICNQINTMGVTSGAPEFTSGFQWGLCYSIFSFICMFCRSLFVLCIISFGHCVLCSSSIYGFQLPLWYLQTLLNVHKENVSFKKIFRLKKKSKKIMQFFQINNSMAIDIILLSDLHHTQQEFFFYLNIIR